MPPETNFNNESRVSMSHISLLATLVWTNASYASLRAPPILPSHPVSPDRVHAGMPNSVRIALHAHRNNTPFPMLSQPGPDAAEAALGPLAAPMVHLHQPTQALAQPEPANVMTTVFSGLKSAWRPNTSFWRRLTGAPTRKKAVFRSQQVAEVTLWPLRPKNTGFQKSLAALVRLVRLALLRFASLCFALLRFASVPLGAAWCRLVPLGAAWCRAEK